MESCRPLHELKAHARTISIENNPCVKFYYMSYMEVSMFIVDEQIHVFYLWKYREAM